MSNRSLLPNQLLAFSTSSGVTSQTMQRFIISTLTPEDGNFEAYSLAPKSNNGVSGVYHLVYDSVSEELFCVRGNEIFLYDTSAVGVPVLWSLDPSESNLRKVSISTDYILLGTKNGVILFNRSDKTRVITYPYSGTNSSVAAAYLCSNGSKFVRRSDSGNTTLEVVDVATLTTTHTLNRYNSSSYGSNYYISSDGTYLFYQTTSTLSTIYNLLTDTVIGTVAVKAQQELSTPSDTADPDYMLIATGVAGANAISLVKLSTATVVASINTTTTYSMVRTGTNTFTVNQLDKFKHITVDTVGETITIDEEATIADIAVFAKRSSGSFQISDTIVDNIYTDEFFVTVIDIEFNSIVATKLVPAGAFTVAVPSPNPVRVTVSPHLNKGSRKASTSYVVNDLVYSDDPSNFDWVYKCVVAGTSGVPSPSWQTTAGLQFADGTVTWEAVEPISEPISKEPVVPTPV